MSRFYLRRRRGLETRNSTATFETSPSVAVRDVNSSPDKKGISLAFSTVNSRLWVHLSHTVACGYNERIRADLGIIGRAGSHGDFAAVAKRQPGRFSLTLPGLPRKRRKFRLSSRTRYWLANWLRRPRGLSRRRGHLETKQGPGPDVSAEPAMPPPPLPPPPPPQAERKYKKGA